MSRQSTEIHLFLMSFLFFVVMADELYKVWEEFLLADEYEKWRLFYNERMPVTKDFISTFIKKLRERPWMTETLYSVETELKGFVGWTAKISDIFNDIIGEFDVDGNECEVALILMCSLFDAGGYKISDLL